MATRAQTLHQVYTTLALISAVVSLGEKLYGHYVANRNKRRRRNFGFK